MMHNWMECKVRYEKTLDNGVEKCVTEPYLMDALSFTEAEARMNEYIKPFISGEFSVTAIKIQNYEEVFGLENADQGDKWYHCRLAYLLLDEAGNEKKTRHDMLVRANNIDDAKKYLDEGMKGTMVDYVVEKIIETQLMDVVPYNPDKRNN
ncbi:MAG: DUF4494 domain-containing protein [Bacteroidales bacterium]|nr:DUF4494 domain-containing protein [Bacteroidales bacterium]